MDELGALPRLRADPVELSPALARCVPARKRCQIESLAGVALASRWGTRAARWVDLCAGKGHLGRTLAALTHVPVELAERDAALCRSADALAEAAGVRARSRRVDVMSREFEAALAGDEVLVALHACGDLHLRALASVRSRAARAALVAPCCYFRTRALPFRGLSEGMRRAGLELSREELSVATLGEAVARPARRARLRDREAWRFGLARLAVELGVPAPRGAPPHREECLEDYCRRALGRPITTEQASRAELRGRSDLERAANYEAVRAPFRRTLEVLLALDRAAWLEEAGLEVHVGEFCEASATPRNIAISAESCARASAAVG